MSLKLDEDLFLGIKKVSEIFNISCSDLLEML